MKKFFEQLLIVVISIVLGAFLGWYPAYVYQKPKIEFYSRPYYKIDNIAIGNIFLTNSGHSTDKNIAITLSTNLKDEDIKIVDLTSSYKIQHNDNKTTIILDEMRPGEEADITFKDDASKDDVEIYNFVSDNSNIIQRPWAEDKEWWYLPLWCEGLVLFGVLLTGSLIGYLLFKKMNSKPAIVK